MCGKLDIRPPHVGVIRARRCPASDPSVAAVGCICWCEATPISSRFPRFARPWPRFSRRSRIRCLRRNVRQEEERQHQRRVCVVELMRYDPWRCSAARKARAKTATLRALEKGRGVSAEYGGRRERHRRMWGGARRKDKEVMRRRRAFCLLPVKTASQTGGGHMKEEGVKT